jgi:hypothetical protein
MGAKRNGCRVFMGNPEGKRPLGKKRNRWRIILKRISKKQDGMAWTAFIWLRTGTNGGSCESGNEHSGYIKYQENSSVSEQLVASHEGLSSMALVTLN